MFHDDTLNKLTYLLTYLNECPPTHRPPKWPTLCLVEH